MIKLTSSVCITVFLSAVFVVGIAATAYYYYGVPHPTRLRILHTHQDEMVNEIVNDFEEWYQQTHGQPIEVTAIHTDPQTAFEKATTRLKKAEAEIWWGGHLSLFKEAHGRLLPYNSTHKGDISLTYPCPLMDLTDNTPHWYAASLYGLGVMYNEHRLDALNLSIPQTWADLTSHRYIGNITMIDPTESEFTSPFIMLTLESRNWTSGWEYLVTLSALIDQYDANEHDSALKVSSDYLPLAVVPDFYAYERMAMNIPQINFTYLDGTILQPDPVAIISKGVYIEEAKAFIDYILTTQAQNIIGEYVLPMRQDATYPSTHSPFDPNFPPIYKYNETFQEIIEDYYKTWITQRHDQTKLAYKEIREANKTKNANSNATHYFNLAWGNFTSAGHYTNRTQIANLYNVTNGWTEDTATYTGEWEISSSMAYTNALVNAQKSKQAAKNEVP
ncbi:MAG: ABC transporter substrate-binding protein [Candidatus Bathyarchaeia archaeon]